MILPSPRRCVLPPAVLPPPPRLPPTMAHVEIWRFYRKAFRPNHARPSLLEAIARAPSLFAVDGIVDDFQRFGGEASPKARERVLRGGAGAALRAAGGTAVNRHSGGKSRVVRLLQRIRSWLGAALARDAEARLQLDVYRTARLRRLAEERGRREREMFGLARRVRS